MIDLEAFGNGFGLVVISLLLGIIIRAVTNLRQSRRLEKCEPLKAGKLLAASKAAYGYRTWLNKSNCSKRLSSFS